MRILYMKKEGCSWVGRKLCTAEGLTMESAENNPSCLPCRAAREQGRRGQPVTTLWNEPTL